MQSNFWFGLDSFNDLFAYLPTDVQSYILIALLVCLVLGIRRVIY